MGMVGIWRYTEATRLPGYIGVSRKRNKTKQKIFVQGRCSWLVLPGCGDLPKQILLRAEGGEILRGLAFDFFNFHNKLRASCGRPQCVLPPFAGTCSSSSSIPITSSPPSPLSKPPPSSRLRVFFFVTCVISIYPSTCPFCLACWRWHCLLYRGCSTSSHHIIT